MIIRKSERAEVILARAASESVRRGHPWVWRTAVTRGLSGVQPGQVVHVANHDGERLGDAVADPESPIALRMWTGPRERLDLSAIDAKVTRSVAIREVLFAGGETTAYRLLHGEGDRMPGFVVDRYGPIGVLRVDGAGASAFAETVAPRLRAPLERIGVTTLVRRDASREPTRGTAKMTELLFGDEPPATIEVREHGVPFVVDLARGQKTGAFLDQRENRRRLEGVVRARGAKRVLNLFSYAGGFSQRAARGGARVTSVDIAAGAHATGQASFRAAGLDPRAHEFVTADAFAFLAEAKKAKRTWDVVVSDPPSFAPSEKALPKAITAYRALHRACADVLADGGVFCAASCSSHVDADAFLGTLDDAALGRADLRLLAFHGPPEDHPTLPSWPEGRYLKFTVLA
jgi:23S rRNA (cytosine1962-C5)-methyltransferase